MKATEQIVEVVAESGYTNLTEVRRPKRKENKDKKEESK